MRKLLLLFLSMTFGSTLAQSDEQNVKDVVNTAYVGGIHNSGPIADIRKGFHPTFIMLSLTENEAKSTTLDEWVKRIDAGRAKDPTPNPVRAEAKFVNVTVVGTSANVTLELFRGEKKVFTDHLLLYKFTEGWRIVGKTFFRHP
jgi:Putative lumazine-binding